MTTQVRNMALASCAAVVLLGYAWRPYDGVAWHIVAGANGLLVLVQVQQGDDRPARRTFAIFFAVITMVMGTLQALHAPSIHTGWGVGLCAWLVALHALLWLDAAD